MKICALEIPGVIVLMVFFYIVKKDKKELNAYILKSRGQFFQLRKISLCVNCLFVHNALAVARNTVLH